MTCADPKDWPSETRENVDCAFRTALAIFLALYFLEVGVNSDPPTGNLPVGFLAVVLIAKMRSDNLGYTLLLGVMLSFVAAVTIPLGYGLIVFLRGLDEQSRTKYNVALPITMFVVGFVFSAFPLPKLPGGATFPTPFRTLGVVLIWLSCYKARRGQDPMFAPKMAATCYVGVALAIGVQLLPLPWPNLAVWRFRARADELDAIDAALARVAVDAVRRGVPRSTFDLASMASRRDATLPNAIATTRSHRAGRHWDDARPAARGRRRGLCGNQPVRRVHPTIFHDTQVAARRLLKKRASAAKKLAGYLRPATVELAFICRSAAALKARQAHIDERGGFIRAVFDAAARTPTVEDDPPGEEALGATLRELTETVADGIDGVAGAGDRLGAARSAASDALQSARRQASKRDDIHTWLWREAAIAALCRLAAHESKEEAKKEAASLKPPPPKEKAAAAPPKCPTFDDFEFPLRIAFHIAFASLWVACPNWSRRADGFGSWVGVSVLSIEQEKLGASFKKMCERFLSNTTAGVFAMIVAQILHARQLITAAILESCWAFLVLSFYDPFLDYAFKGAAYSPAIFLFGGLIGFSKNSIRLDYVSLRITMVSIGIAQTFIFDFILFRRSHRPALRKMTLDWFQKFATACRAAADAVATIKTAESDAIDPAEAEGDAIEAASKAAADLAKATKGAQATYGVAKFEPPCQRPFDAAGFEHLLDAQAAAAAAMTTLAASIKTYVGTRADHRSRMLLHATKRLADQAENAAAATPQDLPTVLAAFEDVRVALIRAREQAWDDYFDRENPQPMDERIGNEASLARMTALGAVEAVCYQLARAAGEVDNLGLPPLKKED